MPWNNPPVSLYHGTDNESAADICGRGVDINMGAPLADFGQAFYTTTNLRQAKNWANLRCRKLRSLDPPKQVHATVLEFQVDRDRIGNLEGLVFIREDDDYWDFVEQFRMVGGFHRVTSNYDVVFGLVSLWPQTLVIKDCDQISFHTETALSVLGTATKKVEATPNRPFLKAR